MTKPVLSDAMYCLCNPESDKDKKHMDVCDATTAGEASLVDGSKCILSEEESCHFMKEKKSAKHQSQGKFQSRKYFVQEKTDIEHTDVCMSWTNHLWLKHPVQ